MKFKWSDVCFAVWMVVVFFAYLFLVVFPKLQGKI